MHCMCVVKNKYINPNLSIKDIVIYKVVQNTNDRWINIIP